MGMIGDLVAPEADQPKSIARELIGDREVREPDRRLTVARDERVQQLGWQ
jgi:hypothetical protein